MKNEIYTSTKFFEEVKITSLIKKYIFFCDNKVFYQAFKKTDNSKTIREWMNQ